MHNPNEGSLPNIYGVSEKLMPQIKDWKVGDTYEIQATVVLTNLGDDYSPMDAEKMNPADKKSRADFLITGIKPIGAKSQMEKLRKRYER